MEDQTSELDSLAAAANEGFVVHHASERMRARREQVMDGEACSREILSLDVDRRMREECFLLPGVSFPVSG